MTAESVQLFGFLVTASLLKQWLLRWLKQQEDNMFVHVGTLSNLILYPVKACKPVYLTEAGTTYFGLTSQGVSDRFYMIIQPNGEMASQGSDKSLCHVDIHINNGHVTMSAPTMPESLTLPLSPHSGKIIKCKVLVEEVMGMDCGDEPAEWINTYLQREGYRIVYYSEHLRTRDISATRLVNMVNNLVHEARVGDMSAYGDYGPYHLTTEESFNDLLARIPEESRSAVKMLNFRPNIVVNMCSQPYEEDNWKQLKIGQSKFHFTILNPRCSRPTIDTEKGTHIDRAEPLRTLWSYRKLRGVAFGPMFGIYIALDEPGILRVGDDVYAIRGERLTSMVATEFVTTRPDCDAESTGPI